MRSSLAPLVASGLLLFGCATPSTPSNQTGTAGSSQTGTAGNSSSGSAGTSGTGNTTGSGTGNTTGSGTAGAGGPACVSDPTNLVRTGGWICDATQPYMIQGAWYGYGDGTSCPASTPNPCTSGSCCMMGATIVDANYKAWGCGLGMELSSSG